MQLNHGAVWAVFWVCLFALLIVAMLTGNWRWS